MSGHNKWSQIQHQKSVTDKKRGVVFSKVLKAITIAARDETNPQFNPRLRSLIEKARENNVPQENIERAIKKVSESKNLEEIIIEAYGPACNALHSMAGRPASIAMIIECITDNHNRTISEIKHLLNENEAKMAEVGSVKWAFNGDKPKFPQEISNEEKNKILKLIEVLNERDDVQRVITNLISNNE